VIESHELKVEQLASLGSDNTNVNVGDNRLKGTFFLDSLKERKQLYLSMLFDHTSTSITIIKLR
jgi:hypothetical protein